jgi:hypothetical protein
MVFEKPDVIILSQQRSGTHLLLSLLASHPSVHGRGECVLTYERHTKYKHLMLTIPEKTPFIFTNNPHHLNIAIIMYCNIPLFEKLCGSLLATKTIHLLRDAKDVALSIAQMEADRTRHGVAFKAHYRVHQEQPAHSPISLARVDRLQKWTTNVQHEYVRILKSHPDVMTITYEEMTNRKQINELSGCLATKVLDFLGLESFGLKTTLKKTAPNVYDITS